MIFFQNSNTHTIDKLDEKENSVSTLLIPENLFDDSLFLKEKNQNNLSLYLRKLLRRYRTLSVSGMLPEPSKIKTEYQENGQNLKRINFRPSNSDWIELGELALAFGKSRCWIFSFLLKLDILGLWSILAQAGFKKIVPTLPNLKLKSFWSLRKIRSDFTRGYYCKV